MVKTFVLETFVRKHLVKALVFVHLGGGVGEGAGVGGWGAGVGRLQSAASIKKFQASFKRGPRKAKILPRDRQEATDHKDQHNKKQRHDTNRRHTHTHKAAEKAETKATENKYTLVAK